jgi:hypothetical protein
VSAQELEEARMLDGFQLLDLFVENEQSFCIH